MELVTEMGSTRLYRPSGESGHHQQAQRWFNAADITVAHQSHLLKQLDHQRCQELFCDCSVLVEGHLFRAHRNVLFASSGYFRMLLSPQQGSDRDCHPGLGSDTASATFDAFSPDTFALILDFIYSGQLGLSSHNVIEVMSAASYLQMNSVINYCKAFIKSSLEISVKEGEEEEEEKESGGGGVMSERCLDLIEVQGPFSCGDGDDDDDNDVDDMEDGLPSPRGSHPRHHLRLLPQDPQTPVGSVSPPPALWTHDGAHLTQQVFMLKDLDQSAPALAARADKGGDGPGVSPAHVGLEEASTGVEDLLDPLDPLFTIPGPERRRRKRGSKRSTPYSTRSSHNDPPEVEEARSQKAEKAEELYASLPTIVGVIGQFHNDSNPTMRFKCPFCTHTVKRKADLKRHLRCHTGERPYPCQACNKRFTRLEHLRSHFETIHQARKLVCRKCKSPVTEEGSHVVCEGTRRFRICATCIQDVGTENMPLDDSLEGFDQEPALLLGVDGEEEEAGDTQRSWMMSVEPQDDEDDDDDEGDLAVDSGTDLIIHEVEDSDEEVA